VLFAGSTPMEIAFARNVSRPTVYDVKNALVADRDLERKPDSDRKPMLNCKNVKTRGGRADQVHGGPRKGHEGVDHTIVR
ncbi:Hypothetical protein FKW44_017478, partial [Caligus rogercresseyi]